MIHTNSPSFVILVTGGTGLVGNALQDLVQQVPKFMNTNNYDKRNEQNLKFLPDLSNETWIFLSRKDGDLRDLSQTRALFQRYRPTHVLHLAAKVGGLFDNLTKPATFLMENLAINTNILSCAHEFKVEKVVSCLSTCIFPDPCPHPLHEGLVHAGPPHSSNFGYAYAKRMLDIMNKAYHQEYGCQFTSVIPTNLYGPYDQFHLYQSHVLPALIHQCYLAQPSTQFNSSSSTESSNTLIVKGTGKPLRQFLFSRDLAQLLVWALRSYSEIEPLILSVDEKDEVSILQVAQLVAKHMHFQGEIKVDPSFSDGQFKKTANNTKLRQFLPDFKFTPLDQGIRQTVDWFLKNYDHCRK